MNFLTVDEIKATELEKGNVTFATVLASINVSLVKTLNDSSYQLTEDQRSALSQFNTFLDNAEEGITKDPMEQWLNREYLDQRECVNLILPFTKGKNEESTLIAVRNLKGLAKKLQDRILDKEKTWGYIDVLDAILGRCLRYNKNIFDDIDPYFD